MIEIKQDGKIETFDAFENEFREVSPERALQELAVEEGRLKGKLDSLNYMRQKILELKAKQEKKES